MKHLVKDLQNMLLQSEVFSAAVWFKSLVSIIPDATTFIDGTLADKIIETAVTSFHYINQATSAALGSPITLGARVKAAERRYIRLQGFDGINFPNIAFDITSGGRVTGTSNGSGSVVDLGDGWLDCAIHYAMVSSSANTTIQYYLFPLDSENGGATHLGVASSGIYCANTYLSRSEARVPYRATGATAATTPSDYVTLYPSEASAGRSLKDNRHRSATGGMTRQVLGSFGYERVTDKFVSREDAAKINCWWQNGVALSIQDTDTGQVTSGYIINKASPVRGFAEPYYDQFELAIELENF